MTVMVLCKVCEKNFKIENHVSLPSLCLHLRYLDILFEQTKFWIWLILLTILLAFLEYLGWRVASQLDVETGVVLFSTSTGELSLDKCTVGKVCHFGLYSVVDCQPLVGIFVV